MIIRIAAIVRLLGNFLYHSLAAGLTTASIIVRRRKPRAEKMHMRFAPMSETGAAILGALVTLTPGTTVIDIDMEEQKMLLHVLDAEGIDAIFASIREDFEHDIIKLFPLSATSS